MAGRVRSQDVHTALQRAKTKISSLEQQLSVKEVGSESEDELVLSTWTHSKELRDSLVDMYKVNPEVNVELKQRLPASSKQHASDTLTPRSAAGCSDKRTPTPTQSDGTQGVHPFFQETSRSSRSPSPLSACSPLSVRRSPCAPLSPRLPVPPPPAPSALSPRLPVPPAPFPFQMEVDNKAPSHSPVPRTDSLSGADRKAGVDRDQNISLLLKELDSLRELNKKLQEQCVQQQRELENRRLEVQIQPDWNHTAALVEEIYSAQRSRDEAVMMRLRLANEERDHALLHAKHLQNNQLESINTEESDADMEEVLHSVLTADSSQAVERAGCVLVDKLLKSKQRSTNITQQEMNVVIQERQAAVVKLKRLEQELINLREQNQSTHTHQQEVEHLERERDNALKVNQALEAELQTLRANHSLHASQQSSEMCVSRGEEEAAAAEEQQHQALSSQLQQHQALSSQLQQHQALSSQLQQMSTQQQLTQGELQRCQQAEMEAHHKVQQLERLVEVLRKKVGTGNVRAVI